LIEKREARMAHAAAAAAAIARAIRASGTMVRVSPQDFDVIVKRSPKALVLHTLSGVFSKKHQYFVSYKGFAFYTKSAAALILPSDAEVIEAEKIWVP
jgi:hypothetical protein